jgi:hypothetical protein
MPLRKRALALGVLLILAAIFVLEQGAQLFAPVAEIAGLSTQYTTENAILSPTIYSVPATNYSFAPESLLGGHQYVGALEVADGRQVGFYVMNEGNFSLWRAGRPASLVFANPNAISYNFTLLPTTSGTYYFVFDNPENSPLAVVFSLSSVQDIVILNPFVGYAGYELLFLGVVLSFFGLGGGKKKAETNEAEQPVEPSWKCKFCGARNPGEEPTFCSKCGRAQN